MEAVWGVGCHAAAPRLNIEKCGPDASVGPCCLAGLHAASLASMLPRWPPRWGCSQICSSSPAVFPSAPPPFLCPLVTPNDWLSCAEGSLYLCDSTSSWFGFCNMPSIDSVCLCVCVSGWHALLKTSSLRGGCCFDSIQRAVNHPSSLMRSSRPLLPACLSMLAILPPSLPPSPLPAPSVSPAFLGSVSYEELLSRNRLGCPCCAAALRLAAVCVSVSFCMCLCVYPLVCVHLFICVCVRVYLTDSWFSLADAFVNSQEWTLSRSVPELKVVSF